MTPKHATSVPKNVGVDTCHRCCITDSVCWMIY